MKRLFARSLSSRRKRHLRGREEAEALRFFDFFTLHLWASASAASTLLSLRVELWTVKRDAARPTTRCNRSLRRRRFKRRKEEDGALRRQRGRSSARRQQQQQLSLLNKAETPKSGELGDGADVPLRIIPYAGRLDRPEKVKTALEKGKKKDTRHEETEEESVRVTLRVASAPGAQLLRNSGCQISKLAIK